MGTHAREGWIQSEGLRLRYVEWGAGDAPAIVALHGLRSFAYTWEPVALPLAGRFRIIALDQRGRGESDWDPKRRYFTEHYLLDLHALQAHLGIERFVLLGHSMGGATAFAYASRHPERLTALVVEDMGPGASAGGAGADRIRRELLDTPESFDNWSEARAYWRSKRPGVSDDALTARVQHSMRSDPQGRIVWRHDAQGIAQARIAATPAQLVDLWPHVEALRTPTLLLRGAQSDFLTAATAQEMVRRNDRIRCAEVPRASHYVHDDNLEGFQGELHGFLEAVLPAAWAGRRSS
jgi:pimeloyl-ACP methyl ester carboxylesterase